MKKIILPVLFLLSSLGALKAQTADDIIDQYITAIGGKDKWTQIHTMKVEGQVEVQGIAIPFTMQGIHLKSQRLDAEFQGNKIIDITTSTGGWSQNPLAGKNTLSPVTEEELKLKLDELDLQDAFVDYKGKGSTVEFLGKDEEDGNEYYKIKLTTINKNEKTYFFDTKTYLVYKVESIVKQQGQEVKVAVKLLDYQTIDFGIKIPFKTDQGMMMMVTKKVTINPVVDESIFKPGQN